MCGLWRGTNAEATAPDAGAAAAIGAGPGAEVPDAAVPFHPAPGVATARPRGSGEAGRGVRGREGAQGSVPSGGPPARTHAHTACAARWGGGHHPALTASSRMTAVTCYPFRGVRAQPSGKRLPSPALKGTSADRGRAHARHPWRTRRPLPRALGLKLCVRALGVTPSLTTRQPPPLQVSRSAAGSSRLQTKSGFYLKRPCPPLASTAGRASGPGRNPGDRRALREKHVGTAPGHGGRRHVKPAPPADPPAPARGRPL